MPNCLKKKLKELFDLIISKISSDGGDFLRIIEIALFQRTDDNKNDHSYSYHQDKQTDDLIILIEIYSQIEQKVVSKNKLLTSLNK